MADYEPPLSSRYCFSLVGFDANDEITQISFCGFTHYGDMFSIISQHEDEVNVKNYAFHYYVGKGLHVFRMDWFPDHIMFYMRGVPVGSISTSDRFIPTEPMHIAITQVPDDQEVPPHNSTDYVDISLILYRVRYIKFSKEYITQKEDSGYKTELFVHHDDAASSSKHYWIIGIVSVMILLPIFCVWNIHCQDQSKEHSAYSLISLP